MTAKLQIAADFALPLDAVTQTIAIVAVRGVGKTHTATVLAEEMLKAGQPVCVYDPTGAWFGLKSSADGRRAGHPVVVFGGEHADVPLDEAAGGTVARVVVDRRVPAVLDVSLMRKGARVRFMTDFAEALYHRNREPLHLILDEAQTIAPQKPFPEVARLLGAMEDIVLQGRRRGLGCTLISQRPALVNKNVLTQCSVLVAMRVIGPQDRAAIEDWIEAHGDAAEARGVLASLPSLAVGEGWVWSPGWLRTLKRVRFRQRDTFDSSATPEVGKPAVRPKVVAEIDLAALGEEIRAAVEKAKADDPAALRRRVAELERQLAERPAAGPKVERVEVPVLDAGQVADLRAMAEATAAGAAELAREWAALAARLDARQRPPATPHRPGPAPRPAPVAAPAPRPAGPPAGGLTGPQQAILDTVLALEARGIPATRDCVARWLAIHPNGGSYGANLGRLRAEGYLDGFAMTEKGRAAARATPTGLEAALAALPDEPKRKIVRALVDAGRPLTRDELAAALGLHPNGGSYGANLGWLRTMGLLTERGPIAVTEGAFR